MHKLNNRFVHLTNDAVQKLSPDYGKYEQSNKLSYSEFEKILYQKRQVSFQSSILKQIRERVTDIFNAVGSKLYSSNDFDRLAGGAGSGATPYNGYELLGLDFMLDDTLGLTCIEVNSNPCLETPCILLQRMIP